MTLEGLGLARCAVRCQGTGILCSRRAYLNVHAYLLLTRVCHVVNGSFPTREVHLFLFFLKK